MKTIKKFLVSGGSGFIGSHVCKYLTDLGHEVISIDNNTQYFYPLDKISISNMDYRYNFLLKKTNIVRGNINNISFLFDIFDNFKPYCIINLAALPLANIAIKSTEEAYNSILNTTNILLEVIKKTKTKLVHISSSMVYGDFADDKVDESSPTNPKEIYGSMKLASEILVKGYSKIFNFDFNIIRPTAVYGPSDNNKRIIFKMIESGLNNKEITLFNPKNNFLDFTFVEDTAKGISLAALSDTKNEIFNISNGKARSLYEAANLVQNHIPSFKYKEKEEPSFYPKRGTLDISKATKLLDYTPSTSIEDGISIYTKFAKKFY